MPEYTAATKRWDHELQIGDSYLPCVVRLTYPDPASTDRPPARLPHDLTGVEGAAWLVSEPGGQIIATPTVTLVDADDGRFKWQIDDTDDLKPGTAMLYVRLEWPSGFRKTVLKGLVTLLPAPVAP